MTEDGAVIDLWERKGIPNSYVLVAVPDHFKTDHERRTGANVFMRIEFGQDLVMTSRDGMRARGVICGWQERGVIGQPGPWHSIHNHPDHVLCLDVAWEDGGSAWVPVDVLDPSMMDRLSPEPERPPPRYA